MNKLATASQENDKAGIIDISKQIAVCAQNVVSISKTIPANAEDKGQILSFALAAKGLCIPELFEGVFFFFLILMLVGRNECAAQDFVCCEGFNSGP